MNYEMLSKANATIKKVDIKGKQYAEVVERVRVFRMLFPNGTISTELLSNENGVCIFKATAMNEEGSILATGHAYEKEGSTFINKTSYIENAESSAVGRCLGMLGIGSDTSIASYEEVANAMQNQKVEPAVPPVDIDTNRTVENVPTTKAEREAFASFVANNGYDLKEVCDRFNITKRSTAKQLQEVINRIALQKAQENM